MRRVASLCLLFWLAVPAFSQETSKLEFKGKTEIVKVERIVRVLDDRLSLKEFPFSLEAPVGAIRPSWTVPAGVTWVRKGRLIEITSAPKGELKISADWAVLNKTTLDITEDFDTFLILIGDVPQPIPPTPPTPPIPPAPSILQQTLQAAYALDADADKLSKVAALADLLANVVDVARGSGTINGTVAFAAYVHNATELHKGIGPGAIPKTRAAVGVYLNSVLPRTGTTDAAYWNKASTEYAAVAQALKGIR